MKRIAMGFLSVLLIAFSCSGAIIADHTTIDMDAINTDHIVAACAAYRVIYGHTSHGSQIITGMEVMENRYGAPWRFNDTGEGGALSVHEEYGDLGHNGDLSWADSTRAALNEPGNDRNVVMWSWCGGVSDNTASGIDAYLTAMNQLESEFPHVKFIYMTGHLDGSGTEGNLHLRNQQIRDYCQSNDKILFDFADIESYDPDGTEFLSQYADDECNYSGGNWADQWCSAHPLSDMCLDCDCAHSKPLNCNMKGRAFWWLLAEMLENSGPGHPTPTPAPATMGVKIEMPGSLFRSGDVVYCNVTVTNSGSETLKQHPLFVILTVHDQLFWGPTFSDFDHYLALYPEFPVGDTVVEVLPEFTWPPVATAVSGCYFITALTNPDVSAVMGDHDMWEFGWLNY